MNTHLLFQTGSRFCLKVLILLFAVSFLLFNFSLAAAEEAVNGDGEKKVVQIPENTQIGEDGKLKEKQTEGDIILTLTLPKSFTGFKYLTQSSDGKQLSQGTLDSNGSAQIKIKNSEAKAFLTLSQDEALTPVDTESDKKTFTKEELILISAGTGLTVFLIAFFLGRRSTLWVFRELRDYIYEDKLD